MRVLVVEDGHEYTDTLERFAGDAAQWIRAGSGEQAAKCLRETPYDAIFLDMRFDRVDDDDLVGDLAGATIRFGDRTRAAHYLQENQGVIILQWLRSQSVTTPVLLSYNFDEEPRRWSRLADALGPVAYVPDSASPMGIVEAVRTLVSAGGAVGDAGHDTTSMDD